MAPFFSDPMVNHRRQQEQEGTLLGGSIAALEAFNFSLSAIFFQSLKHLSLPQATCKCTERVLFQA